MNALCRFIFLLLFLSVFTHEGKAQNTSNKGKEFWVAYPGHIDGLSSRLTLFLSADFETTYQVYIGTRLVNSGSISANTCRPIIINPNDVPVYIGSSNVIESGKAIRVVTERPISLYSVISNNARTGGTLVLPSNTLSKEYYAYTHRNAGNSRGHAQFTVIATEDDTRIEITPTDEELTSDRIAGSTFVITLQKGQIYQYQSPNNGDLTGSHIKSLDGCKSIAVFSGNTWAAFCEEFNPRIPSGGDNLYQQLFPVNTWGKKFVTAPFLNAQNGNAELFSIIVSDDNTIITVDGSTTNAGDKILTNPYNRGAVVTFAKRTATVISATKPISVAQLQTSQSCNLGNPQSTDAPDVPFPGDPEITVLNPVEQTLSNITVYTKLEGVPTQISRYYLNIIIKTADINSFRLAGNQISGFIQIDNEFSYATIDVTSMPAQLRLSAAGGFSAIAYGYGPVESYAYLAGANIQNFTFQPTSAVTGQSIASGCLGEPLNLSINLPYKPLQLKWEIAGEQIIEENSPVEIGTMLRDNILYYIYSYPGLLQYDVAGDYIFKVTTVKPTADNCGNTEELLAEFTVDKEPTSTFEVTQERCQSAEIQFKDNSTSNSNVRSIVSWEWDFGDGSPKSTLQNPIHKYANSGTYNVVLTVSTETKCSKASQPFTITINAKPVAKFITNSNFCVGKELLITNASAIIDGTIKNYEWDFGDGSRPIITSNSAAPVFKYDTPGKKIIKLTVTSDKDCFSQFEQEVNVVALPIVDFSMPGYCINDGLARFTNLTKDYDGTTNNLRFEWDFGDASSSANSSMSFNGEHIYTIPGLYTVTLRVFNEFGCEADTKSQQFLVNPFVEIANFTVKNETNLCSGVDVIINNTSTIATPGKILKIEIYKDFTNNPTSFITINNPQSEDINLSYDTFGGSSNKTYSIKLIAYSGVDCYKEIVKTIEIKPVPILQFDALTEVCVNQGQVNINFARETSGITGTGFYAGTGVISPTGRFNPQVAGVGTFTITYTFTSNVVGSCSQTIGQEITVKPIPTVILPQTAYVLAGGEVKIPATAQGNGLIYNWSPAIGLNRTDVLNPIANPQVDTEYTLTITNNLTCSISEKIWVRVLEDITIPNSFSPNGDNVNDFWNIKYLETYPNATVEVFSRNGTRVFFSKGYLNPFDGNYQNQQLPVGVYYYIVDPRNGRKRLTGSLTIIR
ncbi:MAG: PKD domain-containing protein [Flavobacteriales bacterium]|nr:MAG: PKD domain-containing protein [Flavobacteriales bacterium]